MPPTLALVGRPNVGKSTLFNRLTRSRRALTHDLPGVTRDRVVGEARRPGDGIVLVVDTGGLDPEAEALIPRLVREQVLVAVRGADAVVLVADGSAGVVPQDEEVAALLRRAGRPVVVAVNKADRTLAALGAAEFSRLGFPVVAVSAEHGLGIGELWEAVAPFLPASEDAAAAPPELAVAIVGRPNVGKSSLLNALLGEERALVSAIPGTTRDTVDSLVAVQGRVVRLVDTAGIRRRGRTEQGPEVLSVVMARKAIERAQVCLVVLDAGEGVTAQDTHVAGEVIEAGRAVVVVVNKADLLPAGREARDTLAARVIERLKFIKGTPVHFTSACAGRGVRNVLPLALRVGDAFTRRLGTGELNRVLRAAWERRPPPGGRRPERLYYAAQIGSAPPRIALFTSFKREPHFSYMRYLENALRDAFPFDGVPIRFIMRAKDAKGD